MRGQGKTGSLLAGGLLLTSGAARAEGGMPQLDFGNPMMLAQIVWLVIIFIALFLLLDRWALPKVAQVLQQRADAIGADLDLARAAKNKADAAVSELTAATADARARAQAQISDAVTAARAAQAEQATTLGAQLDRQLAEAEQQIGAARDAAMGALRQVAGEAATALVERLTGRVPDRYGVDSAVDHALAQRRG